MLLLIYCLIYFPLFVGVLFCLSFVMHYFASFLVLQSSLRGREAGCFAISVLQMYEFCYYICHVALPYGALGWYAV